jgi:hypothetical protein
LKAEIAFGCLDGRDPQVNRESPDPLHLKAGTALTFPLPDSRVLAERTYMVRIDLSYHLSERGRREAIKVGHPHQAIHYYALRPGDWLHSDFVEFIDLDKVAEDLEVGEDYVDYRVGAPFGFRVEEDLGEVEIKEYEDPTTAILFDSPMELEALLAAEVQHQAMREAALKIAGKELVRLKSEQDLRLNKYMREQSALAFKWVEDNAHWASIPAVQRLKKLIDSKKDEKNNFILDDELVRKAKEAVAFAEDLQEASTWVKNSGTKRLKQILKEGLLSSSMTLYRDERLAKEHPDWEWVKKPYPVYKLEDPRNPSELMLDAVEKARLDFSDAKLRWDKDEKETVILAAFLKRQVRFKVPVSSYEDDIPF